MNSSQQSELLNSLADGNVDAFVTLLSSGLNPNFRDDTGQVPLAIAVQMGLATFASVLIDYGALLDYKDFAGATPLYYALVVNDLCMIQLLLNKGAPLKDCQGTENALYLCAGSCDRATVQFVLGHATQSDLDAFGGDHWTPLMVAVARGDVQIVTDLLEAGSDVNSCDATGWRETALHLAASIGHEGVIHVLVLNGADLSAKDYLGRKPLDVYCEVRQLSISSSVVRMLTPDS